MTARGFLVGDLFENAARAVPDRVAVLLGDESLTFGRLDRLGNGTARRLVEQGLAAGDRVVVWSATSLDIVAVFAACAKAGVVFVPVNPGLGIDEAEVIVLAARPTTILADAGRLDAARTVAARLGVEAVPVGEIVGVEAATPPPVAIDDHAPHVLFFTSGSTGRPKGAVLSHRVNVLRTHPGAQFEPRGATVCMFPLFHMAGWTIAMQQWQARGAVVLATADPAELCEAVATHRAHRLNCIPLVWRRILEHLDTGAAPHRALDSLRFADTGTSATPVDLLQAIQRAVPSATVRVFYGSTEAGNVMTLEAADFARKPGSVGVPSLHTRARIGDSGELEVAGPLLFDGYFDDPAATGAALVDGWYRTGDLAEIDADGFFAIVGRANTVIRTGGESVVPAEVEAALRDHPALADLAVLGLPDADYGETVTAVIVVRAGATAPTLDELRRFAGARLAGFKLPRRLETLDAIPRTPATGQVQRHLLGSFARAPERHA